jgi:hypothetical protein
MYDLYQLGWYNFQQLCLTIAREQLGQHVRSFLDVNDGGRDGAFTGTWTAHDGMIYEGEFVFQCKFTNRRNKNLTVSELDEEFDKVKKLVDNGICDIYVLMTNAGVSGEVERSVAARLKEIGVRHFLILGYTWITSVIKENVNLRRLVPRLYGLGDLSQILDERMYRQGRVLLESLKDDLAKVVVTNAYRGAAEALSKHNFVLLVGEPAVGKTTIASLLAIAALDEWKASTSKLEKAEQVFSHWNPDDPNQFFWVDDVFGVTQYEQELVSQWNHYIPKIQPLLKSGAKLVLTTRDYIYKRARHRLKSGTFPLLDESQVVINVEELTLQEKQQILYNHLKMGGQPKLFLKKIKPFLPGITQLKSFTPESARRLAEPAFTKKLYPGESSLVDFFNRQESFLVDVLNGLDKDSYASLALIYMNRNRLGSPLSLTAAEKEVLEKMGSTLNGIIEALSHHNTSLVRHENNPEGSFWSFKHPTIGDALSKLIVRTPEFIEIYLYGTGAESLLSQITCGDVGLENAIIIPALYYEVVCNKLLNLKKVTVNRMISSPVWEARKMRFRFLEQRCNAAFLQLYITRDEEVLRNMADPGLYLSAVEEVSLALRLFELGVLPEPTRQQFVEKVSGYAVSGEDLYGFSSREIRRLFNEEEWALLEQRMLNEFIPNMGDISGQWWSASTSWDDKPAYFEDLIFYCEQIDDHFKDNKDVHIALASQIEEIYGWLAEVDSDSHDMDDDERRSDSRSEDIFETERSVFDDIDE